jgi:hypothetical protein
MKLARVMIAALAAASLLFAQEAAPAKAEKGAKKEVVKTVVGTVVSVDAVANQIIVKTKKAEDTLSVEAGAKIMSGKKEIALADIKTDASVTVHYKVVDGKKVATKIMEKAEKAAKVAKVEKKKVESSTTTTTTTEPAPAAAPAPEPAAEPATEPAK